MPQHTPFTGGIFDTNAYLVPCPDGNLLIDAPQDAARWLRSANLKVDLLVLTHGHFDHIVDAAEIVREHACPVAIHPYSAPMLAEDGFFKNWGFALEITPVQPDLLLEKGPGQPLLGAEFDLLLVPGHCPGSLCFLRRETEALYGGDVLFAGGVGRWDLPGGDYETLISNIRTQLLPLPDSTEVFPGHGPATTIGRERATNPFLA